MTELVLIAREDAIAVVTMNRPEAMNALSAALLAALTKAINDLDGDDSIRTIVLTGAGEKAFSAGLDLKELGRPDGLLTILLSGGKAYDVVGTIEQCGKPVIAAVNGIAAAGGFEIALACDLRIGSTAARFADTHARVGLLPGWGLSQRLSRTIGVGRAKEMSLTGNFIDGGTAERWGLLNHICAPEELLSKARALAADIASIDPALIRAYKELIDEGYALDFAGGMALERAVSAKENAAVSVGAVEERRNAVWARGRTQ